MMRSSVDGPTRPRFRRRPARGPAPSGPRPRRLGVPAGSDRARRRRASAPCSSTSRGAAARRPRTGRSRARRRESRTSPSSSASRTGRCSATPTGDSSRCSTSSITGPRPDTSPRARMPRRSLRPACPTTAGTICPGGGGGVRARRIGDDARGVPRGLARPDAVLRKRSGEGRADAGPRRLPARGAPRARVGRVARARGPCAPRSDRCWRSPPPTTARSRRRSESGSPARRRRGELLVIEGAGHFPFAETPDRYWPALIDWLRRT